MQSKLRCYAPLLVAVGAAASIAMAPMAAADTLNQTVHEPDRAARVIDCLSGNHQGAATDREVFDPAHEVPTDVLLPGTKRACPYAPLGNAPQHAGYASRPSE
jgi:hypothetical protein